MNRLNGKPKSNITNSFGKPGKPHFNICHYLDINISYTQCQENSGVFTNWVSWQLVPRVPNGCDVRLSVSRPDNISYGFHFEKNKSHGNGIYIICVFKQLKLQHNCRPNLNVTVLRSKTPYFTKLLCSRVSSKTAVLI